KGRSIQQSKLQPHRFQNAHQRLRLYRRPLLPLAGLCPPSRSACEQNRAHGRDIPRDRRVAPDKKRVHRKVRCSDVRLGGELLLLLAFSALLCDT
ncbi:hypothetical protein DFH09DRAFT_1367427, partial [Mycena vulgaris]